MSPYTSAACRDLFTQLAYPIPRRKIVQPHGSASRSPLLKPNHLHPHVAAADCCLHWLTPYGLSHLHHLSLHLPNALITRKQVILARAVKPKTLSNYGTGFLRFTQYCDALSIPKDLQMPSPEW